MSVEILHSENEIRTRSVGALIAAGDRKDHPLRAKVFIPLPAADRNTSESELFRQYTEALAEAKKKRCRSAVIVTDDSRSLHTAAKAYLSVYGDSGLRLYLLRSTAQNVPMHDRISAFIARIFRSPAGSYSKGTFESEICAFNPSPFTGTVLQEPVGSPVPQSEKNTPPEANEAPAPSFSVRYNENTFYCASLPASAPAQKIGRRHFEAPSAGIRSDTLAARLSRQEETFTQAMLRMISRKGWTEAEVYNRIFMDRRLFNKIRNHPGYQPKKPTAILLAFALRLNYDETLDFIGKAGYTLTRSNKSDVIVEYFLQTGNYDVIELNETLYEFGQPAILKD